MSTYADKRIERVKQKLGILYAKPDFQADILTFREKWNIRENGMETEEDHRKWRQWLTKETNKYADDNLPEHQKQMQRLLEEEKFLERDDLHKKFNAKVPINAFRHEVLGILRKYKISFQLEELIRRYLLFNKKVEIQIPINSITLQENWDFDIGNWQLLLRLSADTTLEDIKAIWPLVMEEQEKLHDYDPKKFQPIPNLELDQRAYELRQQKMPNSEIADQITKEFDLSSYTYKEVSNSLRRHKKRLGLL